MYMPVGQQNLHFMYRWRHRTKEVLSSKSCHTFWLLNHYFDAFFQRLYFLYIFWILDFHSTVFYILHHLIVSFFIFHYLAFFITTTFYIITLFHLRLAHAFSLVFINFTLFRSSHPEVFSRKGVLEICSKFTGEYPCRSVISMKLQSNFIEIILLLKVWLGQTPEDVNQKKFKIKLHCRRK